jgi:DNA-binding MarR family transcriptional regulator
MKDRNRREQFARLLVGIGHAVSRIEREQVCCGDLTFQQFDTLRRIDRDGTDTVGTISATLGIDDSTASRNVAILVRDGYLSRTRDQTDGRSYRLALTARGKAALTDLACEERDVFTSIFDRLAPADRMASLATLKAVESALESDPPACCPPDVSSTGRPGSRRRSSGVQR